jgi:hypothetical protein
MNNGRCGFSLVEVNLAVLLVGIGLLVLFSLFPHGLRENELGIQDTHEAMFAEHVLNGLESNADDIMEWSTWSDNTKFASAVKEGVYPLDSYGDEIKAVGDGAEFPEREGMDDSAVLRKMRYELVLGGLQGRRRPVMLKVKSGIYGTFTDGYRSYFTELYYSGM